MNEELREAISVLRGALSMWSDAGALVLCPKEVKLFKSVDGVKITAIKEGENDVADFLANEVGDFWG